MTTGRINQVTIVRQGWPAGAAGEGGAGETSLPVDARWGARRAAAAAPRRALPPPGNPLSPSSFPRAPVRRTGCNLEAPGGGLTRGIGHGGRQLRAVAPCCSACRSPAASCPQNPSGRGPAGRERPAAPRAWHPQGEPCGLGHQPPRGTTPAQTAFKRGPKEPTSPGRQPVGTPCKIRYKSGRTGPAWADGPSHRREPPSCPLLCPAPRPCSPPPISPPTPSVGRPCHVGLVGHFLFSAKFMCMGI